MNMMCVTSSMLVPEVLRHTCGMCQRGLTHPSNLRTHMFIYTAEKPHRCDVCEKQFIRLSGPMKHMTAHGSDSPHN